MITRSLHRLGLLGTLALCLGPGLARGADGSPIVLKSLRLTPEAIDTSVEAAQVTVSFTASDSEADITYFEVAFLDPMGSARQSASAKFAPGHSSPNSATVAFPRFSSPGTWVLSHVFLADAAGNTLVFDADGLRGRGLPTRLEVTSIRDTVSPRLTALNFSPVEIDTSGAPADVNVQYSATDDSSGVSYIELAFLSPSGTVRRSVSSKIPAAKSVSNTLSVTFPRLSEAGRWTLSSLFLADAAGNTLVLDTQGLTALGMRTSLEVKSTADTKSPTLTSLRFNPEEIDTSQGPATVKVDFSAADDLSGVKSLEVVFVSPSGSLRRSGSTLFTPATQVTDSLNVSFPAFTESGPWTVSTVLVADAAGNTLLLDESELGRLGLRPLRVGSTRDETPPKLIALRCNPDTIDTTEGPVTVTVEFTATDDSSGVKSAEVVLESPSGKVRQSGSAVFVPSKEVNGVMQVTFQRLSEPGAWKVGAVTLADMAGNTLILDKYAMPSRVLQVR